MKDEDLIKKVIFVAVCISISACLQVFSDWFIYWRPALLTEFWRLWTAHWVHVGWIHFLLNMLAFACLPFIFPHARTRHMTLLLMVLSPFISLMFYWFMPHIEAYAGLSGVLHGMYVAVAIVYLKYPKERNFAVLVLALIVIKIIWENTWGNSRTAQLIGSPVLVEAHWLGALGGILAGSAYLLKQKLKYEKVDKINR